MPKKTVTEEQEEIRKLEALANWAAPKDTKKTMLKTYEAKCGICGTKHALTQQYEDEPFDLWAKCPTCKTAKVIEQDWYYHVNTFSLVGDILVWKPDDRNLEYRIELPGDENRRSYRVAEIEKFMKALQEAVDLTKKLAENPFSQPGKIRLINSRQESEPNKLEALAKWAAPKDAEKMDKFQPNKCPECGSTQTVVLNYKILNTGILWEKRVCDVCSTLYLADYRESGHTELILPISKDAKFLGVRSAPGYRHAEILVQVDGEQTYLQLNKDDTIRLLRQLEAVIETAGKNPIDK